MTVPVGAPEERWAVRRALGRMVMCAPFLAMAGFFVGELPGAVILATFAPVVGVVTVVGWRGALWAGPRFGRRLALGYGLWALAVLGFVGTAAEMLYAEEMVRALARGQFAFDAAAAKVLGRLLAAPVEVFLVILLPAAVVSGGVAHGLPGLEHASIVARAPLTALAALIAGAFAVAGALGLLTMEKVVGALGLGVVLIPLTVMGFEVGTFALHKLLVQLDAAWFEIGPRWPESRVPLPLTSQARTPDKMSGPPGESTP